MSIFTDKTLLITGGTGSFGNTVLNGFLNTDIKEIRILSRDEKKQDDAIVEKVIKIDEDDDKYIEMLCEPMMTDPDYCHNKFEGLKNFCSIYSTRIRKTHTDA